MRLVAEVAERVRALFFRRARDRELEEELRFHIDMETEANIRRGMSPEEARRRATLAFGGTARVKEEVREAGGITWLEEPWRDVRFATRSLLRTPGFTTVALLTLAIGIGANVAMFSIAHGVLLRPLPFHDPDRLMRLHQGSAEFGISAGQVSPLDLADWRAEASSFQELAGHLTMTVTLTGFDAPMEVESASVTEGFFEVLGRPMQLGRSLQAADHRELIPSAVISDRLWRTAFGGDPGVLGRPIQIALAGSHTIVGVAPPGFSYPEPEIDVWTPHDLLLVDPRVVGPNERDNRHLVATGRLAPGVPLGQAEAELRALAVRLAEAHPATNAEWREASVRPLRDEIVGDVNRALLIVTGVVGFVLLIACANLANLLLARGVTRSREFAVRTALGAGRWRLVRQLMTESTLLALVGGGAGLLLSVWAVGAIVGLSADTLPRVEAIAVDRTAVGFALLLSLATALLFGLFPAMRTARSDPGAGLKEGRGSAGGKGGRARSLLVVAEVAMCVVLVAGATLMARSFLELRNVDPGFDPDRTLAVGMQLNLAGIDPDETAGHLVRRREELIERVRALPGVVEAGTINALPLRGDGEPFEFRRPDMAEDAPPLRAEARLVSRDYIRAMGIPLLRGDPLPVEVDSLPVPMHVSEAAALRFWPGEDPIGQRVLAFGLELLVTGIVADVRQSGLDREPEPAVYFPQAFGPRLATTLVVRTEGDPLALAGPVRAAIREVDPHQPIRSMATLRGVMGESVAEDRFFTLLFTIFGAIALGLAALGIYGVLAYSVSQRTGEIGVRLALGARPPDVLRMVVGTGLGLVGAGVMLGLVAAFALTRLLEAQLYGVGTTDPVTFVLVPLILGLVALAASSLPALRATRVDPMVALRAE